MRGMIAVVLLAVACGSAEACTDPCPGAVREEHTMLNTQLGPEPVIRCTAPSGIVVSFPEDPNDEAACEKNRAEWLRVLRRT